MRRLVALAPLLGGCLIGADPVADLSDDNACGVGTSWWDDPTDLGSAEPVDAIVSTGGADWRSAGTHGLAECGEPFAAAVATWEPATGGTYTITAAHVAAADGAHAVPVVLLVAGDGGCACVAGASEATAEVTVVAGDVVPLLVGLDAAQDADREQYWNDDTVENGFEADYRIVIGTE